jgi:DNA excision repair protein ERCC-4
VLGSNSSDFGPSTGAEINVNNLISKISLLTVHFKKLRVIWSKNPAHTAQIFLSLKKMHPEDPDLR